MSKITLLDKITKRIEDHLRLRCTILAVLSTILLIAGVAMTRVLNYRILPPEWIVDASIDIICMIIAVLLLYSCFHDDIKEIRTYAFMNLVFVISLCLFVDLVDGFVETLPGHVTLTRVTLSLGFIFDELISLAFWFYMQSELQIAKRKAQIANIICCSCCGIGIFFVVLNWFLGFYFSIDETGTAVYSSLYDYSDIPFYIIHFVILFIIFTEKKIPKKGKMILVSFDILPLAASISYAFTEEFTVLNPAFMLTAILIYVNFYQRKNEYIMEQQVIMTQQSTALMVSQIQPHFLYNSLTTIANLCYKDAEQAAETTTLFSRYLRTNLDSLRRSDPVPFAQELDHIKTYLHLEKLRFEDRLNIEYDIKEQTFLVPSLGLQPIVENSVKHGICEKGEPGTLKFSTKKVDGGYEIIIEDDGVGFDPDAPVADDGRSHVGMHNVEERLKIMCNATTTVTSSPGNGCKTVIFIPEKK